ncbi:MAG TPA: hypothetical protein DCP71_14765 [Verrucomicrobiales bacterium]|nr:hypothetical protein [Verrucomicrobiales bacterium]
MSVMGTWGASREEARGAKSGILLPGNPTGRRKPWVEDRRIEEKARQPERSRERLEDLGDTRPAPALLQSAPLAGVGIISIPRARALGWITAPLQGF